MSNRPKLPSDRNMILGGWIFFIASALCYLVASIRSGDFIAVAGSLFFLIANILFLIPVLREK